MFLDRIKGENGLFFIMNVSQIRQWDVKKVFYTKVKSVLFCEGLNLFSDITRNILLL